MPRCSFVKPGGDRCGATALAGKKRCVFHDPASRAKTAEGRRKGGLNRREPAATLPPDAPPLPLGTMADVTAALGEAYNLVRAGRLAVGVGNCLAVLGQALLKAMEKGELERRLEALEAAASAPAASGRTRRWA